MSGRHVDLLDLVAGHHDEAGHVNANDRQGRTAGVVRPMLSAARRSKSSGVRSATSLSGTLPRCPSGQPIRQILDTVAASDGSAGRTVTSACAWLTGRPYANRAESWRELQLLRPPRPESHANFRSDDGTPPGRPV